MEINPRLPSFMALAATALSSLSLVGCASVSFRPKVESVGEYKNTKALSEAADNMKNADAEDVKVFIHRLPEGMKTDNAGTLSFDEAVYEPLGKVHAEVHNPTMANMGWWFYSYKEGEKWRTGLCAWQVPLGWVTFSLWSWLSPTYYPCHVGASDDDLRDEMIATLRRATKAAGGNVLVVSSFGPFGLLPSGFAFRAKNGIPAAAPAEAAPPVPGATKL
jgi:hypothetical protein